MQVIRVTDEYVLQLAEVTQTTWVASVVHERRAGGATIRESVGRLVAHLEPQGAEERAHWQADLFLTTHRLVGSWSDGKAEWLPQEARIIPGELPQRIVATLVAHVGFKEPLVLVVNHHIPVHVICHGKKEFDD
jgi:hypothetical protein